MSFEPEPQHMGPEIINEVNASGCSAPEVVPLPEQIEITGEEATGSPLSKLRNVAKASIIGFEMSPLDDAVRYSLFAGAVGFEQNPALGAAVLGLSTLATESSAVLASSKWIAEDRLGAVLNSCRVKVDTFKHKLNDLVPKLRPGRFVPNIPKEPEEGQKLPLTLRAAVALNLGSVVTLETMQRFDPSRTSEQNRKDGLRTAAMISGYMAAEGGLLTTGLEHITDPAYLTAAGAAIAGLHYAAHKIRQRGKRDEVSGQSEAFRPRYDLTPEEMDVLNQEIVTSVKEKYPEEGVYGMIISPDHPYSNFVRGIEAQHFPEVLNFPAEQEDNTRLFGLVDTRPGSDRVVHVGTISGPKFLKDSPEDGKTGFYFADELIEGGNFTARDFRDYYDKNSKSEGAPGPRLNLNTCISVETNIRVGDPVEEFNGVRTVDIAYAMLFGLVDREDPGITESAVFATINEPSIKSFERVGIGWDYLMGVDIKNTPEAELGRFSVPVAILNVPEFVLAKELQVPVIKFDASQEEAH